MPEPTRMTTGEALDLISRQAAEIERLRGLGDELHRQAAWLAEHTQRPALVEAMQAWEADRDGDTR